MTIRIQALSSLAAVSIVALVLSGCGGAEIPVRPTSPTSPGPAQPSARAVVAGSLEVTRVGAAGYVFAVRLTESNGVPATVTSAWIDFDNGFGGQCIFDATKLRQTRVPANGTLALDPLSCVYFDGTQTPFNAIVSVGLADANLHGMQLQLTWAPGRP